ncbi:MAG: hypothetical protein WCE64_09520, partial [Bacteroidales bacterium]
MRSDLTFNIYKLILALLFLVSASLRMLEGQEEIGGVVNKYAKVTSITVAPASVQVNPAQAAQFSSGDYVLLIQMQGVGIQTQQGSYGINVQTQLGTPGAYEFLIIQTINSLTGTITFTRDVFVNGNIYNVGGNVQLVQVPFYNSPTVTSTLRSQDWNSSTGTGGVLAMFVGRKLTLNADIDVTGLGFTGAPGTAGIGDCVFSNEAANSLDSYPLSWNNAGFKGEGVAIHDYLGALLYPDHAKGQGRNFSGGGGGNGRFSGGGGGSNRGKGGDGGLEISGPLQCGTDPRFGGFGGMTLSGTLIQEGLFAGGGGGASTALAGSTASAGGNGGGIIIIVADSITGNGHYIRSDGITTANALSNAGAGGGGAGGSIALSFQGFADPTNISARGGNGGINAGGFGEGGGGGGGLIWFSSPVIPGPVASATISGGTLSPTNPPDGTGEIKFSFKPKLNGFLFNYIRSVATGTRTDSTCSNILFGSIIGTTPVGGTPPYTYTWQSKTATDLDFTDAQGVNDQQHYAVPVLLPQTTWFRRVVTDNGAAITDVSLPVVVTVHPSIKNNIIGSADTLCYGQNSPALHSTIVLQDGTGVYTFKWESSSDSLTFNDVSVSTQSFTPPDALIQTTWYRRTVRSGSCVDVSPSVRLTVLDTIRNNSILTLQQEICDGMTFANLSATVTPTLAGGDKTYRYSWESSPDKIAWSAAAGIRNSPDYNPDENAAYFPGQQYFRRVVVSGSNDVCVNISKPVTLNDYPPLTGNSVTSGDQTICSGSAPSQLTGSVPLDGKGPGTYTYTWQDSTKSHTWTDIAGYTGITNPDYLPPALTDTTGYRRIVYSSACTDYSSPVIINVHKPVTDNTISLLSGTGTDTTICDNTIPNRLTGSPASGGTDVPGSYTYQWAQSSDNSTWSDISPEGTSTGYQPGSLTATTYFRRRATSGQCYSESFPVKVTVLPPITNNTISGSQTVCKSNTPAPLTQASGQTLSGGSGTYSYFWEQSADGGATWDPAAGINNASNGSYQPLAITSTLKYRRRVSSGDYGCCINVSNIQEVVLDSLPEGASIDAGRDTVLYSFDRIFHLVADPVIQGGSGKWTVVEGSGSFVDDTENQTSVTWVSPGLNRYLWTITRGACKLEDMIDVTVYDLVVPEGFSPNNDPAGYNNTFVIKGLDLPNQYAELTVINGSGTQVFHTSNRDGNEWTEWDGKNSSG